MKTLPLYELANGQRILMDDMVANGGEVTPEWEAAFHSSSESFDNKVVAVALAVEERKAEVEGINTQMARLAERKRVRLNAVENLKDYLKRCMNLAGREAVKSQLIDVRVQNSPPTFRWTGPEDAIPDGYRRTKVEFDARKAAQDYKDGVEIDPLINVVKGQHVVIR